MMLPDVITAISALDRRDKWLIVGKGPSFCDDVIGTYKKDGYRLCSLNNAFSASVHHFDLVVCNDVLPLEPFTKEVFNNVLVCIPVGIHRNLYPMVNRWDKLCKMTAIVQRLTGVLHGFNLDNLGCHVYDRPTITAHTSVSESAVQLLALSGAKELSFIGVDGGVPYHPAFGVRTFVVDMVIQFQHLRKLRGNFPDVVFKGLPRGYGANSDEVL